MKLAPIVLFVYNRLDHLRQTVRTLKQNGLARESELFIFSDGPKDDVDSISMVAEVRTFIKTITGFKRITIVEQEKNRGLADSTMQGVTEIINQCGKVIVLEDDLETSPDFLRFMNEALDRYENEQQVMQISGHMFNCSLPVETDAVFLPFTNSIGWATWKRSWDMFDPLMSGFEKIKKNEELKYRFNLDGTFSYFQMLENQLDFKIDSWAIRWYLSVFLHKGLVLYPVESLIKHIGFDENGTHAKKDTGVYAQYCARLPHDRIHFPPVIIDNEAYSLVKMCLAPKHTNPRENGAMSLVKKLLNRIFKLFRFR